MALKNRQTKAKSQPGTRRLKEGGLSASGGAAPRASVQYRSTVCPSARSWQHLTSIWKPAARSDRLKTYQNTEYMILPPLRRGAPAPRRAPAHRVTPGVGRPHAAARKARSNNRNRIGRRKGRSPANLEKTRTPGSGSRRLTPAATGHPPECSLAMEGEPAAGGSLAPIRTTVRWYNKRHEVMKHTPVGERLVAATILNLQSGSFANWPRPPLPPHPPPRFRSNSVRMYPIWPPPVLTPSILQREPAVWWPGYRTNSRRSIVPADRAVRRSTT